MSLPQQPQPPPFSRQRIPPARRATYYWLAFQTLLFLPLIVLFVRILFSLGSWSALYETLTGFFANLPHTVTHYGPVWLLSMAAALGCFVLNKWRSISTLPPEQRIPFQPRIFAIRLLLFVVSAPGVFFALGRIAKVVDAVILEAVPEYPADDGQVKDTILAAAAKAAVSDDFDRITQESLQNGDYERARAFVEIAEILPGRSISPETRQRYDTESTWTATFKREGLRCGKAAVLGNAASITEVCCMATTDFINSPLIITFGDARDLIKGMFKKDADPVITTLAVVGAALSLWPHLHAGAVVAKNVLKAAAPLKLSPKLTRVVRNSVTASYDVAELERLGKSGSRAGEHLGQYAARPAAKEATDIFGHAGEMYLTTGRFTTPIYAMKYADDVTELAFSARVARLFGKRADGVFELLGKRLHLLFKVSRVTAKLFLKLTGWVTTLVTAVVGLLVSLSKTTAQWVLRRLLFRWLRWEEIRWVTA